MADKTSSHVARLVVGVGVAALVALAAWIGYSARGSPPATAGPREPEPAAERQPEGAVQEWTCSMHPFVRKTEPGLCPYCSMPLVPVPSATTPKAEASAGPRQFTTTPEAAALMQVQTVPVERRAVETDVRLVGRVTYDETRLRHVTAWVAGRLDRLYANFTGAEVAAGEPIALIYSPELVAGQEELIQSLRAAEQLGRSDLAVMRDTAEATVRAAREKLRLLGLSEEQVREVEERGSPSEHVTISAPIGGTVVALDAREGSYVEAGTRIYTVADLSVVWVKMNAYEADLPWLRLGQEAALTTTAYPGETFRGQIAFIAPVVDAMTRTAEVRVDVPNPDGRLKPDMLVRALVHAPLAAEGEVVQGEIPLVIPASAPLVTGTRAVVYVEVPGAEAPTFEGREIALGPRAGDYYVVRDGLQEGERVVTRGAFKIDSALQIAAKPSMMSPEGGVPVAGHAGHGAPEAAMPSMPGMPGMEDPAPSEHVAPQPPIQPAGQGAAHADE